MYHRRAAAPPPPAERHDLDYQRAAVAQYRRQQHDKWVAEHQAKTRFDHDCNRVRAHLIIDEARRLEREHLRHQLQYARDLVRYHKRRGTLNGGRTIASDESTPPPKLSQRRTTNTSHASMGKFGSPRSDIGSPGSPCESCGSPVASPKRTCACLQAPLCRQVTPKYRALALLKQTFEHDKVEEAWQTLRETYSSDHEMLEDLVYRYGPEPEDVSPNTRLRDVQERVEDCDSKWRRIGENVMDELRYRDSYPNVIRNLSIMRIFLEGSQASQYGCDTSERARRDAIHQGVLDQLAMERQLFFTPRRERV